MKFQSGKLGALIIVITLVITVLAGYCTDVTSEEVTVTDYDYITDISGLFEYTNEKEFINYNPSSNITGYEVGKVTYQPNDGPNNFRYTAVEGNTTTSTLIVDYTTEFPRLPLFSPNLAGNTYIMKYSADGLTLGTAELNGVSYNLRLDSTKTNSVSTDYWGMTTVSELLGQINGSQNSDRVTIDFSNQSRFVPLFVSPMNWINVTSDGTWYTELSNDDVPAKVIVEMPTMTVTGYGSNGNILYTAKANDVYIINQYQMYGYDVISERYAWTIGPVNSTLTNTVVADSVYGYANPSGGVYLNSSPVVWSNGYTNSLIELIVGINFTGYGNLQITIPNNTIAPTNYEQFVDIVQYSSNRVDVRTGYYNTSTPNDLIIFDSVSLGAWDGFSLSIDVKNGTVGVGTVRTVTDYYTPISAEYTTSLDLWKKVSYGIESLTIESSTHSSGDNWRFGVSNTKVFLDTYNSVMIDPTLDIADYFPLLDQYRVNFYSFALVGDSITINGQTFEIDNQTETISFVVDGKTIVEKVNNFSMNVEKRGGAQSYVTLHFDNTGTEIDLGELTTTTISFGGMWYFTTGIYSATTGTDTVYNWNLDGKWTLSSGQTIVIFIGVALLGLLVAKGLLKYNVKKLDIILVATAIVFALIMSGVFI